MLAARSGVKGSFNMRKLILGLTFTLTVALMAAAQDSVPKGASTPPQKVEFSADMRVLDNTERPQIIKLFVGNKRARLDRPTTEGETGRIGSLLIDFDHQFLFLLIPQSKLYLQISGSSGMFFYRGASMFRPSSPANPCGGWVSEANQRGITLRCQSGGPDTVNGRPAVRWDATTPYGGHGSLWYDPNLDFVVKILRNSKSGVQSGYELQNIKEGPQPKALFEFPAGYREFTLTKLVDALTGFGQWQ
jgi:hypothetical protein